MIAPFEYWNNIARPTVQDFFNDRNNVRLAMLACMAVLHTVDYLIQNSEPDAKTANKQIKVFTDEAAQRSPAFRVVRDFALAAKHCRLTSHHPGYQSDQFMIAAPSFAGEFMAGLTFVGDITGGVTVQIGEHEYANLYETLHSVIAFLEAEFSELTSHRSDES